VSRLHRRDPRCDWSLDFEAPWPHLSNTGLMSWTPQYSRYMLTMTVTHGQARQLMELYGARGDTSFGTAYSYAYGEALRASGIELTAAEVRQIVDFGLHPADVLFGAPPACGYRLVPVPDPLLG
jgi:hypothetical protein